MKIHRQGFLTAAVLVAACNPFDPPLLMTPLPNGFTHHSNGGEFGFISDAHGANVASDVLGPFNEPERWCNDFGWLGDLVVCEVIQYGDRAFVDPPKSIEYMLLDTKSGEVVLFKTKSELAQAWRGFTTSEVPKLARNHASTREES